MIITDELKRAISQACDEAGSQSAFAKKTGVKQQNVNRYLNGLVKEMSPYILAKMWSHIYRFMPKDCGFDPDFAAANNAEILSISNEYQDKYMIFVLMQKTLNDIGADSLFFNIMTYWHGMSEEKKKEVFKQIYLIANQAKDK